jgi:hypothetical protein
MRNVLTLFVCLLCFVLNASMVGIGPVGRPSLSTIQTTDGAGLLDAQEDLSPCIARGFRLPRGGTPKGRAPKPKGKEPKQAPKGNGKESPKGSHENNQRESNREKHENANARRQREQKKAEEKREQNKKKNK